MKNSREKITKKKRIYRSKCKCDSCGKTLLTLSHLKKHIEAVHEKRKDEKCDFCSKSYNSVGDLMRHINSVHEGLRDHKCDICEKYFSRLSNLKTHFSTVHKGLKTDLKSDLSCEKSFFQKENLKKHIEKNQEVKKTSQCTTCNISFTRLSSLKRHFTRNLHKKSEKKLKQIIIVHEGHKCDSCGKSFSVTEDLLYHINSVHDISNP